MLPQACGSSFLNMIRWIIFAPQQSLILSVQEAVNRGALLENYEL